jgi:hypothetical protein
MYVERLSYKFYQLDGDRQLVQGDPNRVVLYLLAASGGSGDRVWVEKDIDSNYGLRLDSAWYPHRIDWCGFGPLVQRPWFLINPQAEIHFTIIEILRVPQ